jgi:hypothetical protein
MNIRISSRIWWAMLIIYDDDAPAVKIKRTSIQGSDEYEWWNGLKDITFLFVTVVTSIELVCPVDTYST